MKYMYINVLLPTNFTYTHNYETTPRCS